MKLNQQGQSQLYSGSAITPCEALRPNAYDVNSKTYANSSTYLDARRLNEWKPNKPTDGYYCFMYDDRDHNMQDYLMVNKNNFALNNAPFVVDQFSTNEIDSSHTGPIKKHVYKIDKTKITPKNLNEFWEHIDLNRCEQIVDPTLQRLKTTKKDVEATEELKNKVKNTLVPLRNDVHYYRDEALDHEKQLSNTKSNFNKFSEMYDKSLQEKRSKTNNLESLKTQLSHVKDEVSSCQDENDICQRNLNIVEKQVSEETEWNNDLRSTQSKLQEEKSKKEDTLRNVQEKKARCSTTLDEKTKKQRDLQLRLEAIYKQYKGCETDKQIVYENLQTKEHKLNNMRDEKEACLKNQNELEEKKLTCYQQKQKCNFLQNEYNRIKKLLDEYQDRHNSCANDLDGYKSQKKVLIKNNVDAYNELQNAKMLYQKNLLELYHFNKEESLKVNNKIIQNYNKTAKEYVEQAKHVQGCDSKKELHEDIEKINDENSRLEYMIDAMESKPCKYCIPSVKQCATRFANDPALCGNKVYPHNLQVKDAKKSPVVSAINTNSSSTSSPNTTNNTARDQQSDFNMNTPSSMRKDNQSDGVDDQPEPHVDTGPGGGFCVIS